MKNLNVKPPTTERVTAISLPLDGVATATRSNFVRRASRGKAPIRRVPSITWGEESGVFIWSIHQGYSLFFRNTIPQWGRIPR